MDFLGREALPTENLKPEDCISVAVGAHHVVTACLGVEPRLRKAELRETKKHQVLMTLLFLFQLVSIFISFLELS